MKVIGINTSPRKKAAQNDTELLEQARQTGAGLL
jgi:hypothetical protein